jgi:hypothetical protein
MKFYRLKKLIDGARVNLIYSGKTLIACPDKYLDRGDIQVTFGGKHMLIKNGQKALTYRIFDDKYGRNKTYRLMYFEWYPDELASWNEEKYQQEEIKRAEINQAKMF